MPSKKRVTPISLQPLDALFGTNEETTNGISEIAIGSLHPFTNHPFQVRDAELAAQSKAGYAKLKAARAEVAELQNIRKCVDIVQRAEQPERTQTKKHEQER